MSVFSDYARVYDLIYRDKDYRGEAERCRDLIVRHFPQARTLLDLGCGTGRYEECFAELGYRVTGMDLSPEMLDSARRSAAAGRGVEFLQGDMRDFRLGCRFDVVQALFHVVSYLETDEDLERAFACVREHLEPGGIFLFDCWHGAGVLSDPPVVRVLERRDGNLRVWRTAVPRVEADRDVVQVDYTILATDGPEAALRETRESHRMRYFFLPELHRLLLRAGMRVVDAHPSWHPGRAIGLGDWYLTIVARADGANQETAP